MPFRRSRRFPREFNEIAYSGADRQKTDFYPKGTRAIQLYDAAVNSYFLRTFGRNQRLITCECERSDEPSMVQVLHIANGDTINEKLRTKGSRVEQLMAVGRTEQCHHRRTVSLGFVTSSNR